MLLENAPTPLGIPHRLQINLLVAVAASGGLLQHGRLLPEAEKLGGGGRQGPDLGRTGCWWWWWGAVVRGPEQLHHGLMEGVAGGEGGRLASAKGFRLPCDAPHVLLEHVPRMRGEGGGG